ncbi:tetratricopeptide repeat-containing serine/threonine-protein kinase [Myxococcus sp. AM010]|uniref:tetratricopeptide repeat-containing serine/threonine-protein kinase n=1 Tax=Myxococcus sp. AM010 TaxID=2745138 RepID=UPI00159621EA|nr:tetratricopeptide repeat-containing serine/threonine-protein kinase [Myxococcus sp. AM010]NVJ15698.1 serine/threonine protein kinase [Myxococcus sp. AM010]
MSTPVQPPRSEDDIDVLTPPATPRPAESSLEPLPSRLAPGTLVAERYTVLRPLGEGGMGVVLAAYDARLDRRVALKLLHAGQGAHTTAQTRLLREARAMARLSHPHVVAVYDAGTLEDGRIFIAMECVEGQTLRQWCRERQRSWREVLEAFLSAGRGLAAAHAARLVHRDFKPENVLVGRDGRVRVTDFGVVRDESSASTLPAGLPADGQRAAWKSPLTEPGDVPGTPRYLAPELLLGQPADARSDVFAFCVALYEALFQQYPFAGDTPAERLQAMAGSHPLPPPSRSEVPAWVVRALRQGLQPDPRLRPSTLEALLQALTRSPAKTRLRWLAVGACAAAVLGAGISATALWRLRATERAQLCQGAPTHLAGVWDDSARARVQRAFAATGKPYVRDVFEGTRQVLDAYAHEWAAQHRQACEATRLRGEQSEQVLTLRMACLDRRKQQLAALGAVLSQADEATAQRAVQAAAGLPALSDCADVEGLLAEVTPAPESLRPAVTALREELDRVSALRLGGRYEQATEEGQAAVARARALGHAPTLAEALLVLARATSSLRPPEARPLFTEAAHTALAHRHDRLAVEASLYFAQSLFTSGLTEQAQWWHAQAAALLPRLTAPLQLEALLEATRSSGQIRLGQSVLALESLRRTALLLERAYGPRDYRLALAEGNLALALAKAGRGVEGTHHLERVATTLERLLGPRHPTSLVALLNLTDQYREGGRLVDARRVLEQATTAFPDAYPPESLSQVTLHLVSSSLLLAEGRYEEALARAEQALGLVERLGARQSDRHPHAQFNQARALVMLGRHAEALPILTRALTRFEALSSPEDGSLSLRWEALADCHDAWGRHAEALRARERALEVATRAEGGGPLTARAHGFRAATLLRLGRPAEALEEARQSHPLLVESQGALSPQASDALRVQGEALLALGLASQALPLLEQALRLAERSGVDPNLQAARRLLLARGLQAARQEPNHVARLLADAREDYARAAHPDRAGQAALERWRGARMDTRADRP